MFIFIHLILGLLIGLSFKSALTITVIAILSHFLLDYIPHWDGWFDKEYFERNGHAKINWRDIYVVSIDIAASIICMFVFWHFTFLNHISYNKTNVAMGAFMSILPDIVKLGYFTRLKNNEKYLNYLTYHAKIQKAPDEVDWKLGIVTQIILLMILIASIAYIMF